MLAIQTELDRIWQLLERKVSPKTVVKGDEKTSISVIREENETLFGDKPVTNAQLQEVLLTKVEFTVKFEHHPKMI